LVSLIRLRHLLQRGEGKWKEIYFGDDKASGRMIAGRMKVECLKNKKGKGIVNGR
jgi:hypothetical protein